jgi:bifunctional UDP-N-acetylglucosamine pyrophosphorylase/glucosamine-1-phosphate N-acetyltransferase
VTASFVTASTLRDGSDVGPFSHIRDNSVIEAGVHVGNFAEIKSSTLSERVRMGHFSYAGDATIGADTNIGAGAVTCNFDGKVKHRTVVGERVFVGSDSMLVAPVTIGDDAILGAGSVVTRDVAPGDTVVGVPARSRRGKTGTDKGQG